MMLTRTTPALEGARTYYISLCVLASPRIPRSLSLLPLAHCALGYITILQKLYARQKAQVRTDAHSRLFDISMGDQTG